MEILSKSSCHTVHVKKRKDEIFSKSACYMVHVNERKGNKQTQESREISNAKRGTCSSHSNEQNKQFILTPNTHTTVF